MKRLDQLTQLTAAQLATDDIIGIRDQSAGQTKYITVKDLTGAPDFGWQATGESWAFSSWSSTLHLGVITVPTDATVKYNVGMWVRFSQTTGGTKWGKITAVTSTTLTVQFSGNATVFNNEAITSPVFSPLAQPTGAPAENTFVYNYTNPATAAGTFYFYNQGGIKRLWGAMTNATGTTGGTSNVITFPVGFFTTAPSLAATIGPNATTNDQKPNLSGGSNPTTTQATINIQSGINTAAEGMQIQAISIS